MQVNEIIAPVLVIVVDFDSFIKILILIDTCPGQLINNPTKFNIDSLIVIHDAISSTSFYLLILLLMSVILFIKTLEINSWKVHQYLEILNNQKVKCHRNHPQVNIVLTNLKVLWLKKLSILQQI